MTLITEHEVSEEQRVLDNAICLFEQNQVEQAVSQMAASIKDQFEFENPILLCVMNGGLVLTGLLLKHLQFRLRLDYVHATRYRNELSGTDLQWKKEASLSLKGESVLIIDDILDEGYTLEAITNFCKEEGAAQVHSAVLVEKEHDRSNGFQADNVGLKVPDLYVFGCGMDYKGYWRNLTGIYAVSGDSL